MTAKGAQVCHATPCGFLQVTEFYIFLPVVAKAMRYGKRAVVIITEFLRKTRYVLLAKIVSSAALVSSVHHTQLGISFSCVRVATP